jgi:hypothetical protein
LKTMGDGPFRDLDTDKPTKWHLLHFDIKPSNSTFTGDFSLAHITYK